jgi:hypothetical protein
MTEGKRQNCGLRIDDRTQKTGVSQCNLKGQWENASLTVSCEVFGWFSFNRSTFFEKITKKGVTNIAPGGL